MTRWCWGSCGRELPATAEHFEPTGYWFLRTICRRCRAVKRRETRGTARAKKAISAYNRDYFQRRGKQRQRLVRAGRIAA